MWGFVADRISSRWPVHEAEVDDDGATVRDEGWIRAIDWRTFVCVIVGALALVGVGLRFDEPGTFGLFLAWAVVLVLLLATDLDQRLLPDVLTFPLAIGAVVAVLAGLDPFVATADLPLTAVVAVGIPGALYILSLPFGAGAFGLGDVKFLVGFGLLAGVERYVIGLIAGVLLAGFVIVSLLVIRRITLHSYVPYGPFLIIGALWAILGPR